ncbi:MAG: Ig-like domain-containing protein [Ghiorsea sp.]
MFLIILIGLSSCGGSGGSDNNIPATPDTSPITTITGSAGDGPIIGGAVSVSDANGKLVTTTPANPTTDSQAKFNFTVPSLTTTPLTITVTGGTDLVTAALQDFPLVTVVVDLPANAVVRGNANPLSTLIVESARAQGALSANSLLTASNHVLGAISFGLDSSINPISSPPKNTNIANLTRANEAAAEMIRRTNNANPSLSLNQTIQAIGQDLTDGVIDGYTATGATGTFVSPSLAAHILNQQAQVSAETLTNQLNITTSSGTIITSTSGVNFSTSINAVISKIGNTGDITQEAPTLDFLNQTRAAIAIANTLTGGNNTNLNNLIGGVNALIAGTTPTAVQQTALSALTISSSTAFISAATGANNQATAFIATSTAANIAIDTTAPSAPTINSPSNNTLVNQTAAIIINGATEPNALISIQDNTLSIGTANAAQNGTWAFTTNPLNEGPHIFTAFASDTAGNLSPISSAVSYTIDTTAPNAPVVDPSVPSVIHTKSLTINGLLGSAEPGVTIDVLDGNTSTPLGNIVSASDGSWVITVALVNGSHTLSVIQTDAAGNVSPVTLLNILVNDPPLANAGQDFTRDEQTIITLDASGSTDTNGSIVSYKWVQTSGVPVSIADPYAMITTFISPTIVAQTIVSFNLTVIDDNGASATDNVNFTINPVNVPPVANAGVNQIVWESNTVTLDGSLSSDIDGSITNYSWSQMNGINVIFSDVNAIQPTFVAPVVITPTVLEFTLYVIDNESANHLSSVVSVTVNPLPRTMRGHVLDINNNIGISGAIVTLPNGTLSTSTDSYGAFTITGLPVKEYPTITATMPDGTYTGSNQYAIASDNTNVQFKLVPVGVIDAGEASGCVLSGTVVDAYTMSPIPNVDFYLSHPGADDIGGTTDDINKFVASSDPYGAYKINNIPRLGIHAYHTGSLVGKRNNHRNKQYEGNSDHTFTCDPYTTAALVQDYALHLVVPNTQIIGKLIDPYTMQPLNQAFDIEIHRRHAPNANTSNWIDDSLKLDSSRNPYVDYNTLDGSFTIGELAGETIYDFTLNSLYYAGFNTFISRTLYPTMEQVTPAGQTLNVGTLDMVAANKADQIITLPVDGYTTAGSILNFAWNPNAIPSVKSFVFVIYEESATVVNSANPVVIMPQGSMYLTANFPATTRGFTFDFNNGVSAPGAITGPTNFIGMTEINGPSPLNVGVNYYWTVYGVTDLYNTPGITNDLNNKTISFPSLGLHKFQLQ